MQARLSSFLLPFRQELHLTPTFPSFNSRSPDLSHQNSFWGFRLFCWVIDADIALGIFGGSMLDSSTFWMKQKILDLSSNLQAQALILIQLNCQFPFSVQTLESKFSKCSRPNKRKKLKITLVFSACLHIFRLFAIMKKVRQKHNSSISSRQHFCSVTATT